MHLPYLLFYLGDASFGLPASVVAEVIADAELVRVPGTDASVAGVTFVRGRVFAVIDGAKLLGFPTQVYGPQSRVILLSHAGIEAGLLVSRTSDLVPLETDQLDPLPETLGGVAGTGARRVALGVVSRMVDEAFAGTTLLDATRVLGLAKERACAV